MSTPVIESPTASYLGSVEAALADLPEAERAELLDDVRQHLAEVAAETGDDLEATLGAPAAYAADLRAAAGLAPASAGADTSTPAPSLLARLIRHPVALAMWAFVRGLQSAWWALRGLVATGCLLVIFAGGSGGQRITRVSSHHDFDALAVALGVSAVVASVLAGRALARLGRVGLGAAVIANLLVAWSLFPAATHLRQDVDFVRQQAIDFYPPAPAETATPGSLTGPSGLIYNIYPFDSAGHALTGVQLFDQDGAPINVQVGQDPNGRPLTRQVPVSQDGHALDNVFPQNQAAGASPMPTPSAPGALGSGIAIVPPGPGSPKPVIVATGPAVSASAAPAIAAPVATAAATASPVTPAAASPTSSAAK